MRNVEIVKVVMEAKPGVEITDCFDSLVTATVTFNCEAILIHNDREYSTTSKKVFSTISVNPRE